MGEQRADSSCSWTSAEEHGAVPSLQEGIHVLKNITTHARICSEVPRSWLIRWDAQIFIKGKGRAFSLQYFSAKYISLRFYIFPLVQILCTGEAKSILPFNPILPPGRRYFGVCFFPPLQGRKQASASNAG